MEGYDFGGRILKGYLMGVGCCETICAIARPGLCEAVSVPVDLDYVRLFLFLFVGNCADMFACRSVYTNPAKELSFVTFVKVISRYRTAQTLNRSNPQTILKKVFPR
jgi:hypothetical protein